MQHVMKIGLDVVPMSYPPSGVRAYVEALIAAFRSRDAGIDLVPLAPLSGLTRTNSRIGRLSWDVHGIAESAKAAQVDLLHMTRFAAPRSLDRPLVVTVHDLIPLQLPEYRASMAARMQSELARRMVRSAARIIVPSRYVGDQVHEVLGFSLDRIDVIPMGVDLPLDDGAPPWISGPYVLHAGGFDARKNLPVLVRAFAQVSGELGGDWRLVLLGAPHTGNQTVYPPLGPEIARLGLTDRVIMTGRVTEAEKHRLYRHAAMVAAPSLSEGFGLPVLEAMAHGVPVIASNRTSHPEVAGDAAILIEPTEDAFAAAIIRLASDSALRADLSSRGKARAAEFPWSGTAAATLETYRNVLSG